MNCNPFTLFAPMFVERSNANTDQERDPGVRQRNDSLATRARRVVTAVLLMALLVSAVVLVRLLIYVPDLRLVIEHLMHWK